MRIPLGVAVPGVGRIDHGVAVGYPAFPTPHDDAIVGIRRESQHHGPDRRPTNPIPSRGRRW